MIRIGLVDDDKEHQKLIRQFICRYEKEEQTKICVKEYSDGLQFLEEYEGNLDVVFLDIEMPHMDGMTAARKLREKDTGIKIIFVTNMATNSNRDKSYYSLLSSLWLNFKISPTKVDGEWSNYFRILHK